MENINAISTDRLNEKFSLISIFIVFFIIANIILINVNSKSYVIQTVEQNNKKRLESWFFEENQYIAKAHNLYLPRTLNNNFQNNTDIILRDSSEDFKKNVSYLLNNISSYIYEGNWSTQKPIKNFNTYNGNIKLHTGAALNLFSNETLLATGIKFLEGEYVDNWYFLKVVKGFNSLVDDKNNIFDFNSNSIKCENFDSFIIQGKLFDKVSTTYECKSTLILNWEYKLFGSEKIINKIIGTLKSEDSCEIVLNINFETEIEDSSKMNLKYVFYSLLVTSLCLTQIFSTVWTNLKIQENFTNSNSLSLFTVGQNIIWNAYGCLCHFFLAVNNEQYMAHFGIPAFFFFMNFSIFELRLLYNLWKNQNIAELTDINVVRKKLVKFYITFYVFLFLSLFFVTKFYFEPLYILIAFVITWVPQIVHNFIYKNKLSLPLVCILLNTLNKAIIPIYFRGYDQNIFHVKTDINFVYIISAIIAFEVLFMYLQTICGPRFFIPCKFSAEEHKFYRSKEEIIAVKKENELAECAICLYPLFSDPDESVRKIDEESHNFFEEGSANLPPGKIKICFYKLYNVLFDFHEYQFFNKKPYIITPCNHVFHANCLEDWLRLKRECPTCRYHIPPIDH